MTEILTTEGLKAFTEDLSSTELDRFIRVMHTLEMRGSASQIELLEGRLRAIREELDASASQRNRLKSHQEDLRGVLGRLDATIGAGSAPSDLVQMRLILQQLEAEVEEEIATTRPVELLAAKARLRKEIARCSLVGKLAHELGNGARRTNGRDA